MKKFILLAPLVLLASLNSFAQDIVISTGSEGGSYWQKGHQIKNQLEKKNFDVEVIESAGSGENIDCLSDGECHIAFVQADAATVRKPEIPVKAKSAHQEYVWWAYNLKASFKDLSDIESSKTHAIVIVTDSGAEFTFDKFKEEDSGYAKNTIVYADDLYDAFDLVCDGKDDGQRIGGLITVGRSLPNEVRTDFQKCVGIGQATDSDFNDAKDLFGDKLYNNCEIPKNLVKPLQRGGFGDQDTVCVSAQIMYPKDLDKKTRRYVKRAINKVK